MKWVYIFVMIYRFISFQPSYVLHSTLHYELLEKRLLKYVKHNYVAGIYCKKLRYII